MIIFTVLRRLRGNFCFAMTMGARQSSSLGLEGNLPANPVGVERVQVEGPESRIYFSATVSFSGGIQWHTTRTLAEFRELQEFVREHFSGVVNKKRLLMRSEKQRKQLDQFLRKAVSIPALWSHPTFRAFFEVGRLSFSRFYGRKGKEGWLNKLSGGHKRLFRENFQLRRVHKRWFALYEGFVACFEHPGASVPRSVILVDNCFKVFVSQHGCNLRISNSLRNFVVSAPSRSQLNEWVSSLHHMYQHCLRRRRHLHGSFSPVRNHIPALWLLDGRVTYSCIANAILSARREIFISGWWLLPMTNLVRCYSEQSTSSFGTLPRREAVSLADIITYKAEQGVKVCDKLAPYTSSPSTAVTFGHRSTSLFTKKLRS